jgi:hypothetical protein
MSAQPEENVTPRLMPRDEHGFPYLTEMTLHEKVDEILTHMRTTAITLRNFVESAENNPMLKPFLPKKPKE